MSKVIVGRWRLLSQLVSASPEIFHGNEVFMLTLPFLHNG